MALNRAKVHLQEVGLILSSSPLVFSDVQAETWKTIKKLEDRGNVSQVSVGKVYRELIRRVRTRRIAETRYVTGSVKEVEENERPGQRRPPLGELRRRRSQTTPEIERTRLDIRS